MHGFLVAAAGALPEVRTDPPRDAVASILERRPAIRAARDARPAQMLYLF